MRDPTDRVEETLVRRFRGGDAVALEELFAQHTALLQRRIARRLSVRLRRRLSLADVLQEVRLVAFQRSADFEGSDTGSFRRWLLGIADRKVQEAIQHHQRTARRAAGRELSRGQRPDTGLLRGNGPSPSQEAVAAELGELAGSALRQLPPDYREVLRLTRQEHLGLREVARRIGRSYEATRKLHARALARFLEVFEWMRSGDHD